MNDKYTFMTNDSYSLNRRKIHVKTLEKKKGLKCPFFCITIYLTRCKVIIHSLSVSMIS